MKTQKTILSIFICFCLVLTQGCSGSKASKTKSSKKVSAATSKEHPKAWEVVKIARSKIGTKYKYGGTTKKGMDCSGLVYTTFTEIGLTMPRTSKSQSGVGKRVYIGELQRGDLIFFGATPRSKKITHVGIVSYSKDGNVKMIHSSSSRGVVEDPVDPNYWTPRYIKASRPLSLL